MWKKEDISCPQLNYQTCLCKSCMDNTTLDEVVFISTNQNINKDENNSCCTNVSDDTSISNISLTSGMTKTSINHEDFLTLTEYDNLSINLMEMTKIHLIMEMKYLEQI